MVKENESLKRPGIYKYHFGCGIRGSWEIWMREESTLYMEMLSSSIWLASYLCDIGFRLTEWTLNPFHRVVR